eukprot:631333-Prymnesium_polylepis.1
MERVPSAPPASPWSGSSHGSGSGSTAWPMVAPSASATCASGDGRWGCGRVVQLAGWWQQRYKGTQRRVG